jgi:hypothetical protein
VIRGHRGFHVHKAEVGVLKDIGDIGEERGPARFAVPGRGGRGFDWIVRYDVAGDGEIDLGKIVRVGDNDGGVVVNLEAGEEGGGEDEGGCGQPAIAQERAQPGGRSRAESGVEVRGFDRPIYGLPRSRPFPTKGTEPAYTECSRSWLAGRFCG